ncbi:tripartite tricarboxylate transporter substrate-binding protein [Pseudomonas sp. RIT-PI-AD]|uniref:tripartite tricarboxylate transporter substrate-binding protein n=1 Tax=Pseudomonas sp. RIT-PI-AD TaxID=3035294 RepID=UPI0021D8BBBC|nr:tripartite tricarboxylate transporter substrate-binding protein [Pseudomonas sp. RIT-PI-AD]
MYDRRSFLCHTALLALGAALPGALRAQTPTAPGRLLYGLPAGATGHKLASGALEILSKQLNTEYQLEIHEARNSQEASETVKGAPADGGTLLQVQSGSMVMHPNVYSSLNYDPLEDFTPLALLGDFPYSLTLGPAVPVSVVTLKHYLDWVAENPEYRDIGFSLHGSQAHLVSLVLARNKEIALRPQPYKAVKPLMHDLQTKSLAAAITVAGNNALLGGGQLRSLAVTGGQRIKGWPSTPTFAEEGVNDMDIIGWYGWFAPARLPDATAKDLRAKINAMQATAEFARLQQDLLLNQVSLEPPDIRERMRREIAIYGKMVRTYGISQIG